MIIDTVIFAGFEAFHFSSYSQFYLKMIMGRDIKQYMQSYTDNRISLTRVKVLKSTVGALQVLFIYAPPLTTSCTTYPKEQGEAGKELTVDLSDYSYKKLMCQIELYQYFVAVFHFRKFPPNLIQHSLGKQHGPLLIS